MPRFTSLLFALLYCAGGSSAFAQPNAVTDEPGPTESTAPTVQQPLTTTSPTARSTSSLVPRQRYLSPFASLFANNTQGSSQTALRNYYRSSSRSRLLETPHMFGDYRRGGPILTLAPATGLLPGLTTEVPYSAGITGLKVAENNHALPANRVWFAYNYFQNAFDARTDGTFGNTPASQSVSLNRFVIATEMVLDEGATSLEMRMPFGTTVDVDGAGGVGVFTRPYSINSHAVGNLNLILKRLLYGDDSLALSYGLGVELPTGNSGNISYADFRVNIDARAVHLVPFLAMTRRTERWFGHVFTQLDLATSGDRLRASFDGVSPLTQAGRINSPPLFSLDFGVGYWIIPQTVNGLGMALTTELHYTVPLDNDDSFVVTNALGTVGVNSTQKAQHEVLNATVGLEINASTSWTFRPALVIPLISERVFDTELLLQLNLDF